MSLVKENISQKHSEKLYDEAKEILNNTLNSIKDDLSEETITNLNKYWYFKTHNKIDCEIVSLSDTITDNALKTKETQKSLQINKEEFDLYLQPVKISGAKSSFAREISRLFFYCNYYDKKDEDCIKDLTVILHEALEHYCLYAVQKGFKEYYTKNKDFPSLKALHDCIKYKDRCTTQLFANVNWMLSL